MHVQLQQFWLAVTLLFSAVFVEADISQIEVFSKNYQRQSLTVKNCRSPQKKKQKNRLMNLQGQVIHLANSGQADI